MRMFFALAVIVAVAPLAAAKVWTTVYRCDETTPLAVADPNRPGVYRDIMVGTRLVIVVNSDAAGYWWGQLRLSWDDEKHAKLSGRGYTSGAPGDFASNYRDSCLESAGKGAIVSDYIDPKGIGLEFNSDPLPLGAVPGAWFIFDYRTEQAGSCDVELYDMLDSPHMPVETLSFTHVPSQDFDGDGIVNFKDLHLLGGRWRSAADHDPNGPTARFDLDTDGHIDIRDLALFCDYWLERTDCNEPATDPNSPLPIP
jgi:hypothetical protein